MDSTKTRSRALRLVGGVVLTSALSLTSLAISSPKAAADGFSVRISATGGVGTVDFTVNNTGNGDLVNCRIANSGGESNRSLPKGQDWSGSFSSPAGSTTVTVTCEKNNNSHNQVSDSTSVTVLAPYVAPVVPVTGSSGSTTGATSGTTTGTTTGTTVSKTTKTGTNAGVRALTGDVSDLPVGAIAGLAGMLVAGVGSAIGLARKQ